MELQLGGKKMPGFSVGTEYWLSQAVWLESPFFDHLLLASKLCPVCHLVVGGLCCKDNARPSPADAGMCWRNVSVSVTHAGLCWWILASASNILDCISHNHCHLHNAISIWWLFYLCFTYFKAKEANIWSCEIEASTSYKTVIQEGDKLLSPPGSSNLVWAIASIPWI